MTRYIVVALQDGWGVVDTLDARFLATCFDRDNAYEVARGLEFFEEHGTFEGWDKPDV